MLKILENRDLYVYRSYRNQYRGWRYVALTKNEIRAVSLFDEHNFIDELATIYEFFTWAEDKDIEELRHTRNVYYIEDGQWCRVFANIVIKDRKVVSMEEIEDVLENQKTGEEEEPITDGVIWGDDHHLTVGSLKVGVRAYANPYEDYYILKKDIGNLKAGAVFYHDKNDNSCGGTVSGTLRLCWTPDGGTYSMMGGDCVKLNASAFKDSGLFERDTSGSYFFRNFKAGHKYSFRIDDEGKIVDFITTGPDLK